MKIEDDSTEHDEPTIFDSGNIFKINIIFDSHDAVYDWCVEKGLANRIYVVSFTTHMLNKYKPNRHVVVACERSEKLRMNLKSLKNKDSKKRDTTTKRTNCPFRLRIYEIGDDMWKLHVVKGIHNHCATLYAYEHSLACKLSQKHVETTKRLTKSWARPRQIIVAITDEDPSIISKKQTIYNIRHQLKLEMMENRSVLQQFVKVLEDYGYKYELRRSIGTNEVSDVLFVNLDCLKLLHAFAYILVMDMTYNTNRYKVPLFEIVGITCIGNSFVAGYVFLSSVKEEVYIWALDMFEICGRYIAQTVSHQDCFGMGRSPSTLWAESEHVALKSIIRTVCSTYDYILDRIHMGVKLRVMEIKSKFEESCCRTPKYALGRLFHNLKGQVSLKAFSILQHELKKTHLLENDPSSCICMLRKSHGLPCVHEMLKYSDSGIPITTIHCYWRTLDMETKVKEESIDEESWIHDESNKLFDHVRGQGLKAKRNLARSLKRRYFHIMSS